MMSDQARPIVYLKHACPYCLKLRILLSEAGLADRFDTVVFEDGNEIHQALRRRMTEAGEEPSFPAVEFETGTLVTGSDELIDRIAGDAGIDPAALPLLRYYETGLFPSHVAKVRELRQLRQQVAAATI